MAANNIYIQVDLNATSAQANVNALNNALALTGPTSEKSAKQTTGALATVNVSVSQTTKAFGELTTALAGLGIERMVASMVQMGSELGRAHQAMAAFTGSAAEATRVIEQVRAIAATSPFRFKDLEETARRLLGFGMAAKDVPTVLRAVTNQVTAMGGSIENVNNIVNIFGRIMEKNFVGAIDLLRTLPAQGVPIMKAFQKELSESLKIPISAEETKQALKEGLLDPLQSIRVVVENMTRSGAGKLVADAAIAFKNLGDAIEYAAAELFGPQGFGPAIAKVTGELETLLAPIAGLVKVMEQLPESTKEWIVRLMAFAAAAVAAAGAISILIGVFTPLAGVIATVAEALPALAAGLVAVAPEILAVGAALAGIGTILYLTVPKFRNFVDSFKNGFEDLKKKGEEFTKALDDILHPRMAKGDILSAEAQADLFDKLKREWTQTADAGQKVLAEALISPAEAAAIKYKDLFAKLNEQMKFLKDEGQRKVLTDLLSGAQAAELGVAGFKEAKQQIEETAKLEVEKTKGSYDAQIAYIEAMDEQDLRKKVAAIDQVKALRIESAHKVADIENDALQSTASQQRKLIEDNRKALEAAGYDVQHALHILDGQTQAQKTLNTQKAVDEEQKIRLEGWKKANDAIIEDQKRVYEAFQSMFDEIFDAFTQKTKSIGQALGDVFKKLALGEAKNFFSSQAASFATELAGYGTPEPGIRRSGGILGTLLQRGMPPRPIMAPPEAYVPAKAESGISFGNIVDGGGKGGANREIANAAGVYNVSAIVFSNAVNRFSDATVSHQGSADRMMESSSDISEASDAIQRASTATGVPQSLLRAVARTESGMHPGAVSPKGAQGLFQLMPATQQDFGVTNPFDPYQSAIAGGGYLQQLYTRYGSWPAALAAYNYGPTNYNRAVAAGRSLPAETQAYVQRVMGLLGGGMPQPAAATGGPVYDVGARFSVTGYGAPETAEGGYTPVAGYTPMGGYSPISGADIGSLTAVATPTEIEKAKQASVLAQVLGVVGTDVNKAATGGGGSPQQAGLLNLSKLSTMFGIGQATGGGTTLGSVLSSKGISNLVGLGGMAAIGAGLNKRNAPLTTLGGAMAGFGMTGTSGMALPGGAVLGPLGGVAVGAGAGLYAAGIQRGGFGGMAMDIGGGALAGAALGFTYGGPLGAAIGAGIGAAVGVITGVVRLFVKTEQEKIRAQIKQVYGIDIPNRQILTQIQQIVDQSYGGNVAVGIRSQQVQDLVRLYALSTGQAANMPRPMYAATIAQSTQGLQLQPVYQGGVQVANPYSGPTTYQYQTAVAQAMGANPNPGSGLGVPGAAGLINTSFQQLALQTIQGNPASIAMANAAAATAGDSRLTTTAAMQEPLTALS